MNKRNYISTFAFVLFSIATASSDSGLSPSYYDRVCPEALPTIKRVVEDALAQERRMGASLLLFIFMIVLLMDVMLPFFWTKHQQ
ncbi:putative peroxidase [Helianthus debilis subsp. tardiflorus]